MVLPLAGPRFVAYADAKISYFNALRAAMPDLFNIATGRKPRPPDVDKFRDAFHVAGEIQEIAADKENGSFATTVRRHS